MPPLLPPTCDQLGHVNGAFQFDALQLIFQDQLVVRMDVFAPWGLGEQVVLEFGDGEVVLELEATKALHPMSEMAPQLPIPDPLGPRQEVPSVPTGRVQGEPCMSGWLTSSLISRRMDGWSGMALNRVPTTQHFSPGCSSHSFFIWIPAPGRDRYELRPGDSPSPPWDTAIGLWCHGAHGPGLWRRKRPSGARTPTTSRLGPRTEGSGMWLGPWIRCP